MLKNYIEQIKHNQYLRQTTFLFAGIGLSVFIIFTIIVANLLSNAAHETVYNTEYEYLNNSCKTGDLMMRTSHSQLTSFAQENGVIQKALTYKPYPLNSLEVTRQFDTAMLSNNLIHSMYIINLKYDTVYSTVGPRSTPDDFFDHDAVELVRNSTSKVRLNIPRTVEYPSGTTTQTCNYITYVYECTNDGALVVNLDAQAFAESISFAVNDTDMYRNILTTRDGYVFFDSLGELFGENIKDNPEFEKIFDTDKNVFSDKNESVLTFAKHSTQSGCYYIRSVNESALFIGYKSMLKFVLIFAILLILAYFCVSLYCTKMALAPIYTIKNTLSEITNYNDPENEIKAMQGALKVVAKQNIDYQTLKHNLNIRRRKELVNGLVTGSFSYNDNDLAELGITIPYSNIAAVMIKIDNVQDLVPVDVEYIKYGIINIAEELFEQYGRAYFTEQHDSGIYGFVSIRNTTYLVTTLKSLQKHATDIFNVSLTISYDTCDNVDDIVNAFINARYASSFRITHGYGSVIAYSSDMEAKNVSTYPYAEEKAISAAVKTGKREGIALAVHSFIEKISHSDYNVIILYVGQLALSIDQLASPHDSEDTEIFSPLQTLFRIETLEDCEKYLLNICENKASLFSASKTDSRKVIIVDTIVEFINNHYKDPQLSIDMIATEVSRSANYTRSIFKQIKNVSISEYIQQLRFDELCKLLRETNLPAQELGKQVGLSSGSYFYTSFKKYTGYTLEQYRALHTENNS